MSPERPPLRIVTDAEADVLGLRAEALARLRRRYPKAESRRAMEGSLKRLVETFTGGVRTVDTFEWELLVDEELTSEVWDAVACRYARATALKDASFLREMLRSCSKLGLLTYEQYASARSFETRGGTVGPRAGRHLTPADVNRLVAACQNDNGSASVALRDTAVILCLASSAARRSELAAVTADNVHLHERRLWLTNTKSGRPRDAWLHPSSAEALALWIDHLGCSRQAVFPALSRTGRPLADEPMSDHQIWKIVHRRAEQAGLSGMTPHDLRRFVVSTLLDNTHDLALVARIVGHANPTTTAGYDRRPDERSRAAVATLALPRWRGRIA
mgnify:CR=1 FL=1